MTTNILTAEDEADIRGYVDRLDPTIGQGYTGWAIVGLLATLDAARAERDAIDKRRTDIAQCLVELRSAAGQALENDQADLRAELREENKPTDWTLQTR